MLKPLASSLLLALALVFPARADELLLEAEAAEHAGVLVVDTARAGYSGTGYVTGIDQPGDSLRFRFEVGRGVYALRLGVYQPGRLAPTTFWVDGVPATTTLLGTGGGFAERVLDEVWLAAGTHTLVVRGGFEVDYLRVVPVVYEGPTAPPPGLTDPLATPSARALHGFLLDTYGEQILAGQQDLSEIQYVQSVTGRVPALGSFDLIEYSPSRVACGARPGQAAESWISWARQDAVVSLMWHWNAPTDLIDANCDASAAERERTQAWWSGFYTSATTFDFAAALADPTSEEYALLLRDIDAIAVQLRKFEAADVPVLWRPLHEAAGGWFWWGSKGAGPFVQLWRLLYDRLVHHHGLHHLLWVYTHEPDAVDWYPGDAYVDIASRDVYADDPRAIMKGDWDQLQALYGARKLVTLSESGTLPDPAVVTDYGIWWSWFAIWSGSFIRGIDRAYLRQVYQSEHVMTRDELPAWRSHPAAVDPGVPAPEAGLVLYPNPTRGGAVLRATLPAPADVRVELFDLTGRRLRAYALGFRPAGVLEAPVETGEAAGVYLVRVVAGGYTAHRMLVVTP